MFFADVSGLYGDSDADDETYVRHGLQIPSNDPTVLRGALVVSTKNIGLALTSNVMQNHPFDFARQVSTLDHISNGRIAWNIVTGTQDNGARNYGLPRLTDHAERYRWADEYVSIEGFLAHSAFVDKTGRVYDENTPLKDLDTNTAKGFIEWAHLAFPDREPTLGDLVRQRANVNRIVGTPEQIADRLEEWQDAGVDGITVINWVLPGSFVEFADKVLPVLPVLRERSLAQTEYAPGPLREKLFGSAHLNERHPAAAYRGAFADGPANWDETDALKLQDGQPAG